MLLNIPNIIWPFAALAVLIIFIVKIYIAYIFYTIAVEKGYDEVKFFFFPFLFGLIGYLMVVALPDRNFAED